MPRERSRIEKASGYVSDGQVLGEFNKSKGIGVLEYKRDPTLKPEEQLITVIPDITKTELGPLRSNIK